MLFGKLSDADKNLIQAWISDYAVENVTTSKAQAPLSYLLRYWNQNKVNLYNMFGQEFILSKQIMFAKDAGDMEREIADSLYYNAPEGERSMHKFYIALDQFAHSNYSIRWDLMELCSAYHLAKNEYHGGNFIVPVPDGKKPIQVQSGCKPMKILGKIAQAWNLQGFEDFRLEHSRILNQKMLKGELCISIHPMDYMTMSDNDCDWDSCMSWRHDGCYRRGTVEMMNSDCVVVAYLKAKEDMRFYDKYWNNKKWRQLFIVQQDYIVGVKGYPYCHDGLADAVINWLAELAEQNNHWAYKPTCYTMEHESWFKVDEENWKLRFYTNTMYNDFGCCSHRVRVSAEPTQKYEHYHELTYSGPEVCMWCGGTDCDYDEEGPLTCSECEDTFYCSCCDTRYSRDDLHEVDGGLYCSYCYEDHVLSCPVTGNEHHESDMTLLYVTAPGVTKISDRHMCHCIYVDMDALVEDISDEEFAKFFKLDPDAREFHSCEAWWRTLYFVTTDELTEEGLALFDLEDAEELAHYLESQRAS